MSAGSTPQSPMPAQTQQGEYRKIQELASGGMGSVELSRAVAGPRTGAIVAIKRLHPHLEREQQFADMFFDEAVITAGLKHPNVVSMFDWGTDSYGRYLAMEFVPGESLLALIREAKKQNRMIPIDLALFMIGKTAEGLHAAHELRNEKGQLRHLVHRDVTPSNVLVGITGDVKLIDFGVAKARDKLSHTSTGTIKGKFGYMSPEQARGFPIDRRSDVFSLGVVLWETLALKRLYRSESELEILRMIVEDPPQPIRDVRPDVPAEIENVLQGALAKNRDDRLGSCGEFAEFVWAIYHEHGYTAGEAELAEYFRTLMPDRVTSLEQLLSGANEFIEPTVARPASGSFSGPRAAKSGLSGKFESAQSAALPILLTGNTSPSIDVNPSLLATSYSAPVSQAPAKKRGALIGAVAAVGVLGLVGVGWMVGRSHVSAGVTAPVPAAAHVLPAPNPTAPGVAALPVASAPQPQPQPPPAEVVGVPAPVPPAAIENVAPSEVPLAVGVVTPAASHGNGAPHVGSHHGASTQHPVAAAATPSEPAPHETVAAPAVAPPPHHDPPATVSTPTPSEGGAPAHHGFGLDTTFH